MTREVRRFADPETTARAAAAEVARQFAATDGRPFSVVLAGGSTPRRVYELLAEATASSPRWAGVSVFFGDERCVPPDDPDSNFRMAKTSLLDRIATPGPVHRIPGELGAQAAADDYERRLRAHAGAAASPLFDLVLLGMGEDGHTASLFPGDAALAETERWAVPVETTAKAPRWRVSLSLPALSAADEVMFLVTGAGKRDVLAQILADPDGAAARFPAAAVTARRRVTWFVDDAACGASAR